MTRHSVKIPDDDRAQGQMDSCLSERYEFTIGGKYDLNKDTNPMKFNSQYNAKKWLGS